MDSKKKGSPDALSVSQLISQIKTSKVIASEPPEFLALNQRKAPRGVPFTGSSYSEMVQFVLGNTGITESQFDAGSAKYLSHMFEELRRYDVYLFLDTRSGKTRVIYRYSNNAVGIVFDSRTWEGLYEIGRVIIESGTMILHPEPKLQGCRETGLRKKPMHVPGKVLQVEEPPIINMIRGLLQEPGIAVHELDLIPLTETPAVDPHDSTVYVCNLKHKDGTYRLRIKSVVASYIFGLNIVSLGLDSLQEWPDACVNVHRDGDLFLIEDEGVLLLYEILPLPDSDLVRRLKAKTAQHNLM